MFAPRVRNRPLLIGLSLSAAAPLAFLARPAVLPGVVDVPLVGLLAAAAALPFLALGWRRACLLPSVYRGRRAGLAAMLFTLLQAALSAAAMSVG